MSRDTPRPLPPLHTQQPLLDRPPPPSRHPLAGLTLDKEYQPYVAGRQASEVQKVFNTPTLSTLSHPYRRGSTLTSPSAPSSSGPQPQWPPSAYQIHGRAEPTTGRAWTYSLEENKDKPIPPLGPNFTGPSEYLLSPERRAFPLPVSTSSPRKSDPHLPTPVTSSQAPPPSDTMQIDSRSSPRLAARGSSSRDQPRVKSKRDNGSGSDEEMVSAQSSPPSTASLRTTIRLRLPRTVPSGPSRSHSSSLSSTISVPLPRDENRITISPPVSLPAMRRRTVSDTPSIDSTAQSKGGRRDMNKRRQQNVMAQRKLRSKNKAKAQDVSLPHPFECKYEADL